MFIVQGHFKQIIKVFVFFWDIGADPGGGVAGFPFWFKTNIYLLQVYLLQSEA